MYNDNIKNLEQRKETGKGIKTVIGSHRMKMGFRQSQDLFSPMFYDSPIGEALLTTKQLANILGCSVSYIKKLKSTHRIHPEVSFPKFIRYKYSSVVAALKKSGGTT